MHVCVLWKQLASEPSLVWTSPFNVLGRDSCAVVRSVKCHSDIKPDCNERRRHLHMWGKRDGGWTECRMRNQPETNERGHRERERDTTWACDCVGSVSESLGESGTLPFQQVTRLTPASRWRWMHLICLLPKLHLSTETHADTHPTRPHTHSDCSSA